MSILGTISNSIKKTNPSAPTLSTSSQKKDTSNTMAGNVANNLNTNSLLMTSAAAKGERQAAARGLQNSTAGIEASQRAMIDAATPIAQVDTANSFTASQNALDRTQQTALTKLQGDISYNNQSRLNNTQNQFSASQAALDRTQQSNLAKLQSDLAYNNQSRLNNTQNQFSASQTALDRAQQTNLTNLQHQNAMKQLNSQVSANTIGKSIDFAQQITNNFDAQIAGVLQNSNMKAEDKEKAINQLKASRDSELQFMSAFFSKIPTTRQNWSSFPNLGVPSITIK